MARPLQLMRRLTALKDEWTLRKLKLMRLPQVMPSCRAAECACARCSAIADGHGPDVMRLLARGRSRAGGAIPSYGAAAWGRIRSRRCLRRSCLRRSIAADDRRGGTRACRMGARGAVARGDGAYSRAVGHRRRRGTLITTIGALTRIIRTLVRIPGTHAQTSCPPDSLYACGDALSCWF